MAEKTVTLTDAEWQQLVAIIANATGWPTVNKVFTQLQAQDQTVGPNPYDGLIKPNGLDEDTPHRRVPRAQ